MLGVALAFAGVLYVIVKGHWRALGQLQFSAGGLWILAAASASALYAVLQKKWPNTLTASARLTATCAGRVAALLPFAVGEWTVPGNPGWSP